MTIPNLKELLIQVTNNTVQSGEPFVSIIVKSNNWPKKQELEKLAVNCINACKQAIAVDFATNTELGLTFANDSYLKELNLQWRNIDKPTNVLSFPIEETPNKHFENLLGDIVISYETTVRESTQENIPFEHHLSHLIVHGILHLFHYGHESEEDATIMEALEAKILGSMNIPNPHDKV